MMASRGRSAPSEGKASANARDRHVLALPRGEPADDAEAQWWLIPRRVDGEEALVDGIYDDSCRRPGRQVRLEGIEGRM
jgi:hypothetical protein